MVSQYPYELWIRATANSTLDTVGNPTKPFASWMKLSGCRDEANGKGAQITLTDGTTYQFDSVVYLPVYCPVVEVGTRLEVRDASGTVRLSGKVNRFQAGQLNARLWV